MEFQDEQVQHDDYGNGVVVGYDENILSNANYLVEFKDHPDFDVRFTLKEVEDMLV